MMLPGSVPSKCYQCSRIYYDTEWGKINSTQSYNRRTDVTVEHNNASLSLSTQRSRGGPRVGWMMFIFISPLL